MSDQRVYKFESSDNQIFEMTTEDVDQSVTLTRMVDSYQGQAHPEVIAIRRINGGILKLIAKWLQMHRMDTQSTSTWPQDYLKSMDDEIFDMFMWAAEFLVISSVMMHTKQEMIRRVQLRRSAEFERIFGSEGTVERRMERDKMVLTIKRKVREVKN